MFKKSHPYILFVILFSFGCTESAWYQKIEKTTGHEKIETNEPLSKEDDIVRLLATESGQDHSKLAFRILLNTNEFANSYVGGMPSEQVLSFDRLMENTQRKEIFRELLKRANKAGQLYALIALSRIDYQLFVNKIKPFLNDSSEVKFIFHDTAGQRPFNEFLVSSWSREYLLNNRSVNNWLKKNPLAQREPLPQNKKVEYDVINGGWLQDFKQLENWGNN